MAIIRKGAYTDSRGIEVIRKDVEKFISERDGIEADYNNIYLINGATDGIRVSHHFTQFGNGSSSIVFLLQTTILLCLMDEARAGVMIPIPQYPLYTAAIAELNAHPVSICMCISECTIFTTLIIKLILAHTYFSIFYQ